MPDLFDALATTPLSVTQVNQRAKQLLERQLGAVTVVGEVSNLKTVSSHRYFTLKDKASQLPAVLFRREAEALRFRLEAGMEVVASGRLTIYPPYGRYQMVVDRLEPRGAGALQLAFEQLKAQLEREGLFDATRKRPLPLVPRRVAVVTSPTGAVIRDIVNVATRRFPQASLVVAPTRVQGTASAPGIRAALERVASEIERLGVDVVIVARGGGSLEDLWGFNDEAVARAIAAMPVPVVSGVGHETDFTIADFVADHRAPTPSAAAELVFPIHSELVASLERPLTRARRSLRRDIESLRHRLQGARARLGDGRRSLDEMRQRLAHAELKASEASRRRILQGRLRLTELTRRLEALHPRTQLGTVRLSLRSTEARLERAAHGIVERRRQQLGAAGRRLEALSPLGILDRGYSIALDGRGRAVRDAAEVAVGDALELRLSRGRLSTRVESVEIAGDGEDPTAPA